MGPRAGPDAVEKEKSYTAGNLTWAVEPHSPSLYRVNIYRVFRAQAGWTLTHTSEKDTEQSTVEASITFDGVTLTDSLLR
jgi:hypothetical protein